MNTGFGSVRFTFGPEISHDPLNQSDWNLIPIDRWSLVFSRASSVLVFTLSTHRLPVKFFFPWFAVVITMVFVSQHWHKKEANFPRNWIFYLLHSCWLDRLNWRQSHFHTHVWLTPALHQLNYRTFLPVPKFFFRETTWCVLTQT